MTLSGPCESWTPTFTCALPTGSAPVSGTALEVATEVLYALSGRRFGLCTVTLRPCRAECFEDVWGAQPGGWWEWGQYPQPALIAGSWFNITCGGCAGDCNCTSVSEVVLPAPVKTITAVKVDGVTLAATDYRVDDYRRLVRLGGEEWPRCNDLNLADTEVGTWSVTVQLGESVPPLGQLAVGQLTIEIAKLMVCDSTCALPKPVQSLSRQGVNVTFLDPNEVFADGRTGLYLPDLFLQTYNPNKLRQPSKVYDIDSSAPRKVGT